ncbi:hypothetical protein [Pontibacter mangrovi]|uniref:Uncharacterized protein n=1 Tax=Pontibacter mangrovi TaxID=2589816 RepID=A0A501W5G0_9BACT|nr:hypothetical protein [Pontibacter mangrovi]TPE43895.1 hypothetical protein FJM65_10720 [Pontibacter mangrovi]
MRNLLFILVALLAFSSCGPNGHNSNLGTERIDSLAAERESPHASGPDTAAFTQAFNRFFSALQAGDTAALEEEFVDAGKGLWLIEQPGALPAYHQFRSIKEVQREYQQRPFTSISQEMQECLLQRREAFPAFDCAAMDGGATGFSEDGCFYTFNTADFQRTDMWKYASLSEQEARQVQELQQQVQATVLHTGTSYRFHFGYRNGRWLLLFADLRVPCSA